MNRDRKLSHGPLFLAEMSANPKGIPASSPILRGMNCCSGRHPACRRAGLGGRTQVPRRKNRPTCQTHDIFKTQRTFLLLPGGEGRDEGGCSTNSAASSRTTRPTATRIHLCVLCG